MSPSAVPPPSSPADAAVRTDGRVRPFRLTRFFSISSLLGILVVTAALFGAYRELMLRTLVEHESRANADVTRAFANSVWERYRGFVLGPPARTRADLLADPVLHQLHADLMAKISGLDITKVKIYNLDGLTVFSTDEKQIGEDKRDNPGFREASAGQVSSVFVFREKFDAFEGTLSNRNLVASYIPVRSKENGQIEGVFEVYTDITDSLELQRQAQWKVAGLVMALLGVLYVFLFFIVRKADRVIVRQERERAEREALIRHQAYHDVLTGLPNRAYFTERLREAVALASRHGHMCALMFIDLDRFKRVNDSLGHDAGDRLLTLIATRIRSCLRNSDSLFRVGGDEFTVILPEVAAPQDAAIVARRVIESVSCPAAIGGHELAVGATIGIAVYPSDGDTADSLLRNADAAMYSIKASGRGSHAFYRATMNHRAHERLALESEVRKAVREGELVLHYQPRVEASTRSVVAYEALLRWVRPSGELVLPEEFVGILEETGMIAGVGEWVLRSACEQAMRGLHQGRSRRISVNLSGLQFQNASFVALTERILRELEVPDGLIEYELAESLLARSGESSAATIRALAELGVRIAIDDFGSGTSSLSMLRELPIGLIKLDRSLVAGAASDGRDRAFAAAAISVAHALDITVIAEGVETEAQASCLAGIGCDELQGFLFGAAAPAAQAQRDFGAQAVPQPVADGALADGPTTA